MVEDSLGQGDVCKKCSVQLTPNTTIRLWDGNRYCRACVDDACPGLAEYAETHETLKEVMPHSAWRIGANYTFLSVAGMIPFGAVLWSFAVWCGADPIEPGSLFLLLVFPVLGVPIGIMFATLLAVGFALNRPIVSARDGQLLIDVGRAITSVPLSECEWYTGWTCHMNDPRLMGRATVLLCDVAVVIVLPRRGAGWYSYVPLVPTGFTETTRTRWQSFLTLAGVPHRVDVSFWWAGGGFLEPSASDLHLGPDLEQ